MAPSVLCSAVATASRVAALAVAGCHGGGSAPKPLGDGAVLLEHERAKAAAVGVPGKGARVGFSLELVGSAPQRAAAVTAHVAFVGARA